MKNLGLFVALIVLNNASFGSPWLGYALWNPKEGTTDASFAVIFQGQNYLTPKAIVEPGDGINRASPEWLLGSQLKAINQTDGELYHRLFAPGEMLSDFSPEPTLNPTRMFLRRLLWFGGYSVMLLDIENVKGTFPFLSTTRKSGEEYFLSHLVKTNKAYALLSYYYTWAAIIGMPVEKELVQVDFGEDGYVYITNSVPANAPAGPPLIYRFQGADYRSGVVIKICPKRKEQDTRSTKGALAAVMGALKAKDVEWYSELRHPEEKTATVPYGLVGRAKGKVWDNWMRETFLRVTAIEVPMTVCLDQEILFGDCVVLSFHYEEGRQSQRAWLCFRKAGNHWYISDKLNASANPLLNYLGYAKQVDTKLYPHFVR